MRSGSRAELAGVHTVVTVVDVDDVTVVQPLEGTRNIDVEVEVVLVFCPVNPLETADDVFVNVFSE